MNVSRGSRPALTPSVTAYAVLPPSMREAAAGCTQKKCAKPPFGYLAHYIYCRFYNRPYTLFPEPEHQSDEQSKNCNIDNDYEEGTLFYDESKSSKKIKIKQDLREKILTRQITDNSSGLKYTLKNGCLPTLFVDVVKELKQENKLTINGTFSVSSANIHRIKPGEKGYYEIETI